MMYLNGVESEKIKSEEIVSKVVRMVEKKAREIEIGLCLGGVRDGGPVVC